MGRWQSAISGGFPSFIGNADATLVWMSEDELYRAIEEDGTDGVWFRLVLLETMLFEPYYPLSPEDEVGNVLKALGANIARGIGKVTRVGYGRDACDRMLEKRYAARLLESGYIRRLRRCHRRVMLKLNEVLKTALLTVGVTGLTTVLAVATAGAMAPSIAVSLVGSNFAGLSGAALTSACLAYLGGGAVAVGGAGMAGGIATIVAGGALLGFGVGGTVSGTAGALSILSDKEVIMHSARLLTAVQEIFLNDERETECSQTVLAWYVNLVSEEWGNIKRLEFEAKSLTGEEKKEAERRIKETRRAVEAMERAWDYLNKLTSSFEVGIDSEGMA